MTEPTTFRFPFGQFLKPVRQTDRSPKEVFVLGVYASAVHARWVRPNGERGISALAVASEPYIFWRGDREQEIIDAVNKGITNPERVGKLVPPKEGMNGPSGVALDEGILKPLGFTREQAWLCDLVPHSCCNPAQTAALKRSGSYGDLAPSCDLPEANIPLVPKVLADEERRTEILAELDESKARLLVLLGDLPIKWFLSAFDSRFKRLDDFRPYGQRQSVSLGHRRMDAVALVHPRQAARLGRYSQKWFDCHKDWADRQLGQRA